VARYERKDRFHQRAKREGYRSRAAYKLLELQRSQRLLRPGQRVVDLGCWPGGWLQVAAAAVGPSGRVVGLDLADTQPLAATPQAVALRGDLSDPDTLRAVRDALGGAADAVLCDAAPKLTGVRATDRAREGALLEAIEAALPALLRPGGTLLVKILEGPEAREAVRRLGARFERTRTLRPRASRKGTTERYLLAQGWRAEVPADAG